MTKPVQITAEAEREIHDAITWYNERRLGLGDVLREEVIEALDGLRVDIVAAAAAPGSIPEEPAWRILLKRFPYSIVFLDDRDARRVIAFAHFRRRPGYWAR